MTDLALCLLLQRALAMLRTYSTGGQVHYEDALELRTEIAIAIETIKARAARIDERETT